MKDIKKNKQFNIAILIGIISILISIELPYSDKCIAQLIIPLIKLPSSNDTNFVLMLAGLIPLIGIILCYIGIIRSKKFDASRFKIFFIMFVIVIPILVTNINIIKAPIYMVGNGVRAIEVIDSSLNNIQLNQERFIQVNLELKSYKNITEGVRIVLKLPDKFDKYIELTYILFKEEIWFNKNQEYLFTKKIKLIEKEDTTLYNQLFKELYSIDYSIILIEDGIEIENIRNDLY